MKIQSVVKSQFNAS